MRGGAFSLVVAVALARLALGCDGQSTFSLPPVDAGPPDARYAVECAAWARSRCANENRCAAPFQWDDGAQCVDRETLACELLGSDPNVAIDTAQIEGCPEPDAGDCSFDTYCLGPGRAATGTTCLWNEACRSGFCARSYNPYGGEFSPCGTCQPPPCDGGCPGGQACFFHPDGGASCAPLVGVPGDPCSGPDDCNSVSYCAPTGLCAMLPTVGEACGDGGTALPCGGANEYCDGTGHCRENELVGVGYGESCGTDGGAQYLCTGNGVCDLTQGRCLPPASDGELCDDSQSLGCLPPAKCIGNRCLFPSLALCSVATAP